MEKQEFIEAIREYQPDEIAEMYLNAETVTAFPVANDYKQFKDKVKRFISGVEKVSIVGSGNWRFSLNPNKNFKEFDKSSDIDIAIVSREQFTQTWEELRRIHRSRWYTLSHTIRERIRRNAEDVYGGFITPLWIPGPRCELRYRFKQTLNRLSDKSVNFMPVKILFFKNFVEAIDYYKRGFLIVRRKVKNNEI